MRVSPSSQQMFILPRWAPLQCPVLTSKAWIFLIATSPNFCRSHHTTALQHWRHLHFKLESRHRRATNSNNALRPKLMNDWCSKWRGLLLFPLQPLPKNIYWSYREAKKISATCSGYDWRLRPPPPNLIWFHSVFCIRLSRSRWRPISCRLESKILLLLFSRRSDKAEKTCLLKSLWIVWPSLASVRLHRVVPVGRHAKKRSSPPLLGKLRKCLFNNAGREATRPGLPELPGPGRVGRAGLRRNSQTCRSWERRVFCEKESESVCARGRTRVREREKE